MRGKTIPVMYALIEKLFMYMYNPLPTAYSLNSNIPLVFFQHAVQGTPLYPPYSDTTFRCVVATLHGAKDIRFCEKTTSYHA